MRTNWLVASVVVAALAACGGGGSDSAEPAPIVDPPPPPSAGAVTLDWTPPTENSDGSPLSNLAGYRINYGTSPSALNQQVSVGNPGLSSYVVENLAAGTWHFTVKAYNSQGAESDPAGPVSATVR